MARFSIGPSSYGDLKGVTQYVNTQRIADQFNSMARDFDKEVAQHGERLSANEGMRSRPRQQYLWNNRVSLGVVVAPPFSSRHDEVYHGNAIDVGVTMANGQNRALTDAEFAWMHSEAEKRGFTWTGRNFGEPWHIEGATRGELKLPYPNPRIANTPIPVKEPTPPPVVVPPVIPNVPKEDDMFRINSDSGNYYLIGELSMTGPMTQTTAAIYTKAAGEDAKNFAKVTSAQATRLIQDMRDRRDSLGLRISDQVEKQINAALKAEGN